MRSQNDENLPRLRGSLTRNKSRASDSVGRSGDTQGLSDEEDMDSESVVELLEEGQAFEAEAVGGVENALVTWPAIDGGSSTSALSTSEQCRC